MGVTVGRDLTLDRPEIPLHTNGSERYIRLHVTRRKISGPPAAHR